MQEEKNNQSKLKIRSGIIFCAIVFLFVGLKAQAATLTIYPSSGSYQNGKTFSASVFVTSAEQAMNAASGIISYPADKLEVLSVSKSGSIISLWAQEPLYGSGQVEFAGIVLNPGYKGASGKILTINFKAKSTGSAAVNFSSGSVLANDGQGTNIISSLGSAKYNINVPAVGPQADESTSPVERAGAPLAPRVTSPDCPDSQGWCNGNDPTFNWNLPAGATGVSIMGDRNPNTNPGAVSDGLISSHTYKDTDDGVWYFHIRLRNSYGWGAITHYKFQIDTKKPESFDLSLAENINSLDPKAKLSLDAKDSGSGISKYEIKIDNNSPQTWVDDGSHIYRTETLATGKHTIVAKAIDGAGNFLTSSLEVTVNPIDAPKITDFPEELTTGETLIVKGRTYPNAQVIFWLQKEGAEPISQTVKSGQDGKFKLAFEGRLGEGVYQIWAEAVNENGATSGPSDKLTIVISQRAIIKIGSIIVSYLSVVISLIALIVLLLITVWYSLRRLTRLKNKIKKEVATVEKSVHEAFDFLRENTRKQVSTLEKVKLKRELTKEEARILIQLKNQLNDAEKYINKEMEKIEKEVK